MKRLGLILVAIVPFLLSTLSFSQQPAQGPPSSGSKRKAAESIQSSQSPASSESKRKAAESIQSSQSPASSESKHKEAESHHAAEKQTTPASCKDATSCGQSDISLDSAKESFDKATANRGKCRQMARESTGNFAACDFVAATEQNICGEIDPLRLYYYWAPVSQLRDGQAALSTLLERAKSGRIVQGREILDSLEDANKERHLALCTVKQIGSVTGVPKDCVTVAIITPETIWLRGGTPRDECYTSASFRKTGAIEIRFDIKSKTAFTTLPDALVNMLTSDLGLSVSREADLETTKTIALSSASGLRDSKILPQGWRESLDFDIMLSAGLNGETHFSGVAHAMVARQALGNLAEYQGLDDAQRSAYADALDAKVNATIKSVCTNYRQLDAKNISCD